MPVVSNGRCSARCAEVGCRRDHQLGGEADALVLVREVVVGGLHLLEQQLGAPSAERLARLPDRGQGTAADAAKEMSS